jgi:hypothetical protein
MFGSSRIKIDKALLSRAKRCADLAGYSSVDEFIVHIVEREIARVEEAGSEDEMKKRLRGLGYIS